MSRPCFLALVLVLSWASVGCRKNESPVPSPSENALKALALAPVSETGDVLDASIAQFQKTVTARPELPEGWVSLGHLWIRKARLTADSGFYLSADAAAQLGLKARPGYPPARALRAVILVNQHRFAEARD